MPKKKTILMTGAAGDVATFLRRELAGRYELLLSDRKSVAPLGPGEQFRRADLTSLAAMRRLVRGVDAVVHLGGFSVEADWNTILQANIIGAYNLFEAARLAGVKRMLFASSNHAVGFYPRDQKIDDQVYPRPDSRYGLSKVFGEQLGRLYADKYGLEVFCMRIGNVATAPVDRRRLAIWISPRDLAELVCIGIERPQLHFEIVYGVSDNRRAWWDNRNARRLGYRPQDRSEQWAKALLSAHVDDPNPMVERFQGGTFVATEFGGDPNRPLPGERSARRKRRTVP